jgi:microsomal dipeptidase-like Zn-dependent dipeptidase
MHFLLALLLFSSSAMAAPAKTPTPVTGFADLHNHVFAEYAFGGAWFHGSVVGDLAHAMSSCEIEFDPFSLWADHARVKIPFISRFIGKTQGSWGDTGSHLDKIDGYPNFSGWPRWDTIAHQQNWEGYLKSAHENGLNLMILSAVNFEPLCELMPDKNKKFDDCSDMYMVDLQLKAAHAFEKTHPWFKIVTTPAEAREAIAKKQLAVILSIEVTNLFGTGDWRPSFEHVYHLGVRTFQIAHQMDNRFGGVAIHNPVFRMFEWLRDFRAHGKWYQVFSSKFGFQYEMKGDTRENVKGLTDEGKILITEMMNRHMMIDLAHMSEQSVRDVQALTLARNHYPVYVSHGHFRRAMDDGKFSVWEKSSADWVLDYVRDSGGLFGLRTGPEKTKSYVGSLAPNDCQGSSKSFAQTYQYGRSRGLNVAFGSDLNGFIQQLRPRFGNHDETCGAETDEVLRTEQQHAQKDPLKKRFDQSGFGDVSQLPDVITELKHFGVDTQMLESSAENLIRMWEKASAPVSGTVPGTVPDTGSQIHGVRSSPGSLLK